LRANAVDVETPLGEGLSKVVSSRTLTQFPEICQVFLDYWIGMACKRTDKRKVLNKDPVRHALGIED
jgi:hypothetical protein